MPLISVDLTTPYFIGRYPITNRCRVLCETAGVCAPSPDGESPVNLPTTNYSSDRAFANHPSDRLRWSTARRLCQWLGGDLPTVMQWRFAMRGPNDYFYPWGDVPDCTRGDFEAADGAICREDRTRLPRYGAVDAYPAGRGPFGSLDVMGGVWEWTLDYAWSTPLPTEPFGYEAWLDTAAARTRVLDPSGPTEEDVRRSGWPVKHETWGGTVFSGSSLDGGPMEQGDPEMDPGVRWGPTDAAAVGARCVWRSPPS